MSRLQNMNKPMIWSAALLLAAIVAGCSGSNGTPGAPGTPGGAGSPGPAAPGANPSAVNLLSASTYALTTSAGLTTTNAGISGVPGSTTFNGDVAMDAPTQTCTATPANATIQTGGVAVDSCGMETSKPDFVNGPITPTDPAGLTITGNTIRYASTNNATFNGSVRAVKNDVNTAWRQAFHMVGGALIPGPGVLDGLTLTPGTYISGSTMTLGNGATLTLDAGGNANAAWIFQVGSSLTVTGSTVACTGTAPNFVCQPTQVKLINGAQAKNVFWEVGTPDASGALAGGGDVSFPAATGPVQNNTIFAGTILAGNSVTFAGGTAVTGRILAGAALSGVPNVQTGGAVCTSAGSTGPVTITMP